MKTVVQARKTIGQARQEAAALRPRHELLHSKEFQDFVQDIEQDLEAMDILSVRAGRNPNAAQKKLLDMLGFDPPQTHEETLVLYFAIRGVVGYWQRKLGQLKSESERLQKLEKEIANATGRANVGTGRRIVGSRIQ